MPRYDSFHWKCHTIPAFCRHGSTRPIDYSKRIDFERLFPIFGHRLFERIDFERLFPIFGTCLPGGDRKREYYFLGGYDISSGNGHNGVTLMMQ
jgi:hypothetical protein